MQHNGDHAGPRSPGHARGPADSVANASHAARVSTTAAFMSPEGQHARKNADKKSFLVDFFSDSESTDGSCSEDEDEIRGYLEELEEQDRPLVLRMFSGRFVEAVRPLALDAHQFRLVGGGVGVEATKVGETMTSASMEGAPVADGQGFCRALSALQEHLVSVVRGVRAMAYLEEVKFLRVIYVPRDDFPPLRGVTTDELNAQLKHCNGILKTTGLGLEDETEELEALYMEASQLETEMLEGYSLLQSLQSDIADANDESNTLVETCERWGAIVKAHQQRCEGQAGMVALYKERLQSSLEDGRGKVTLDAALVRRADEAAARRGKLEHHKELTEMLRAESHAFSLDIINLESKVAFHEDTLASLDTADDFAVAGMQRMMNVQVHASGEYGGLCRDGETPHAALKRLESRCLEAQQALVQKHLANLHGAICAARRRVALLEEELQALEKGKAMIKYGGSGGPGTIRAELDRYRQSIEVLEEDTFCWSREKAYHRTCHWVIRLCERNLKEGLAPGVGSKNRKRVNEIQAMVVSIRDQLGIVDGEATRLESERDQLLVSLKVVAQLQSKATRDAARLDGRAEAARRAASKARKDAQREALRKAAIEAKHTTSKLKRRIGNTVYAVRALKGRISEMQEEKEAKEEDLDDLEIALGVAKQKIYSSKVIVQRLSAALQDTLSRLEESASRPKPRVESPKLEKKVKFESHPPPGATNPQATRGAAPPSLVGAMKAATMMKTRSRALKMRKGRPSIG